jgi:hypothetical protein
MASPFITVTVATSPWEAHVLRGLLESEGIPAVLFNEHHVWLSAPTSMRFRRDGRIVAGNG